MKVRIALAALTVLPVALLAACGGSVQAGSDGHLPAARAALDEFVHAINGKQWRAACERYSAALYARPPVSTVQDCVDFYRLRAASGSPPHYRVRGNGRMVGGKAVFPVSDGSTDALYELVEDEPGVWRIDVVA